MTHHIDGFVEYPMDLIAKALMQFIEYDIFEWEHPLYNQLRRQQFFETNRGINLFEHDNAVLLQRFNITHQCHKRIVYGHSVTCAQIINAIEQLKQRARCSEKIVSDWHVFCVRINSRGIGGVNLSVILVAHNRETETLQAFTLNQLLSE